MRRPALRFAIVGVLLIAGAAAAVFAWRQVARTRADGAAHERIIARLDRVSVLLRGVADEELRSVALGVPDRTATTIPDIVATVEAEAGALGRQFRSEGAAARLATVVDAARLLAAVDVRARENVRVGRLLMATDLILTEGRSASASIESALSDVRTAEIRSAGRARAGVFAGIWGALGGVAVLWAMGLLLLARTVEPREEHTPIQPERPLMSGSADTPGQPSAPDASQAVDPEQLADVCTAIARASTTSGLTETLERAARALRAPGLIVWMGSADELFAALGVGYDQRIMTRLGTIPRHAENATAAAWRTGEMQTVAGDIASRGAIVVPMCGPEGSLGVLAAEVPSGKERDPLTQAAVRLIAAQLVPVMSAWPSASSHSSEPAPHIEAAADHRLQA